MSCKMFTIWLTERGREGGEREGERERERERGERGRRGSSS